MLERIDSRELAEWQAFYSLWPFGDERADIRQAMTSMILANAYRGKNSPPVKIQNFLPFSRPPQRKEQTAEQMMAATKHISQTVGKYGHS